MARNHEVEMLNAIIITCSHPILPNRLTTNREQRKCSRLRQDEQAAYILRSARHPQLYYQWEMQVL